MPSSLRVLGLPCACRTPQQLADAALRFIAKPHPMQKDAKVDLLPIAAPEDISDAGIQTLPCHTFDERNSREGNSPFIDVVVPGREAGFVSWT